MSQARICLVILLWFHVVVSLSFGALTQVEINASDDNSSSQQPPSQSGSTPMTMTATMTTSAIWSDNNNNNSNDTDIDEANFRAAVLHGASSWETKRNNKSSLKIREFVAKGGGGLIFFLHIPKTGGTSVRKNLEHLDHVQYIFGRNFSTYWDTAPMVEEFINTKNNNNSSINKTLFYEIHAKDAPSFFKLAPNLQRWKATARHHGVPTFFFTLLRDPLDFSFSHFNFFHVQKRNPTFEQCNATEANFLRLSLQNPQCQFLFKGETSLRNQKHPTKPRIISPKECHQVYEKIDTLFDWVGTTERLSNETLPLLGRLLGMVEKNENNNETTTTTAFQQRHRISKTMADVYFGKENVTSPSTMDQILQWSRLDTLLYQSAQQRYPYSMWNDENEAKESPSKDNFFVSSSSTQSQNE